MKSLYDCKLRLGMSLQEPPVTQDVLILRVAGLRCAIAADCIGELILMPALTRLPGQPAILDGFMNLRGAAVPVASLHRLFELWAPEPHVHSPLVTIKTSGGLLALRADSLEEVAAVDSAAMLPCDAGDSLNGCAEAQFDWNGRPVAMLSSERLFMAKERHCMADLQAQMQRRLDYLEEPDA
jgi:purine-binding chemotaxis protein CheW